jgi:hypothetical protein
VRHRPIYSRKRGFHIGKDVRWAVLLRDAASISLNVGDIYTPFVLAEECVAFLTSIRPGLHDRRHMTRASSILSCMSCGAPHP